MGIEPTLSAWEAEVLPLNYTRMNLALWAMVRHYSRMTAMRQPFDKNAGYDSRQAVLFTNRKICQAGALFQGLQ